MSTRKSYPLDIDVLEKIIDRLPIGAIILDDDGIILRFNRYEEQLSGLSREQTIGRSFFSDVAPCTRDIDLGPRFHAGVEANNLDIDVEFTFPYPYNRVPRDVHIRAVSVSSGERDAHVVLIEDITSRKQLERNNADMMTGLRSMIAQDKVKGAKEKRLTLGGRESFESEAYVLYANVSDYTSAASNVAPSELFRVLDRRMRHAIEIIHRRGGEIDEIRGDGVLALFLIDRENPRRVAFDVARAALALSQESSDSELELPFRVGVTRGLIANGPIGRIEFGQRTSVGRPIVVARALAQVARPHEVIVVEALAEELADAGECSILRGVPPQGVSDPGTLYRLTDLDLP